MLCAGGYDFSGAAFAVTCSERVNGAAAELVFWLPADMSGRVQNGDEVVFSQDKTVLFHGYVFAVEQTERLVRVTALDSLRYLAAVMPLQREAETAAVFAKRAVMIAGGRTAAGTMEDNGIVLSKKRFDDTTLLRSIYRSLSESERAGGERLILRDEDGKICLKRESSLILPLVLGEDSIATGYCRSRSIAENVVNYVKAIAENKADGMRTAAIARNDDAISRWGLLSKTVACEGEPNKLLTTAGNILAENCRETERITISAKGDARVRAGCCLTVALPGEKSFLSRVTSSNHNIKGTIHTMRLELERI